MYNKYSLLRRSSMIECQSLNTYSRLRHNISNNTYGSTIASTTRLFSLYSGPYPKTRALSCNVKMRWNNAQYTHCGLTWRWLNFLSVNLFIVLYTSSDDYIMQFLHGFSSSSPGHDDICSPVYLTYVVFS